MRIILQIISYLALLVVVLTPVLFLTQTIELDLVKSLMLTGTIVWFASTPFWMGREPEAN